MRFAGIATFIFAVLAQDASADEFVCTNSELEVACNKGKCEKSDGFTPSSVSIDTKSRDMSVCMYSMCLEGKADLLDVSKGYVFARGDHLKSNTGSGALGSGALVINLENNAAAMISQAFINPMTCEKR